MGRAHPAVLFLLGRGRKGDGDLAGGDRLEPRRPRRPARSSQGPDAQKRDAVSVTSASAKAFRKAASTSAASAVLPWALRL